MRPSDYLCFYFSIVYQKKEVIDRPFPNYEKSLPRTGPRRDPGTLVFHFNISDKPINVKWAGG